MPPSAPPQEPETAPPPFRPPSFRHPPLTSLDDLIVHRPPSTSQIFSPRVSPSLHAPTKVADLAERSTIHDQRHSATANSSMSHAEFSAAYEPKSSSDSFTASPVQLAVLGVASVALGAAFQVCYSRFKQRRSNPNRAISREQSLELTEANTPEAISSQRGQKGKGRYAQFDSGSGNIAPGLQQRDINCALR